MAISLRRLFERRRSFSRPVFNNVVFGRFSFIFHGNFIGTVCKPRLRFIVESLSDVQRFAVSRSIDLQQDFHIWTRLWNEHIRTSNPRHWAFGRSTVVPLWTEHLRKSERPSSLPAVFRLCRAHWTTFVNWTLNARHIWRSTILPWWSEHLSNVYTKY